MPSSSRPVFSRSTAGAFGKGRCPTKNDSAHHRELSAIGRVIAGKVVEPGPVVSGLNDPHQGLDARIAVERRREAKVVRFIVNGDEAKPRLLANKPHADADVGPAAANRLGD